MKKKILIAVVVLLVLAQIKRIDKTNPPIEESKTFYASYEVPEKLSGLLDIACMDCHSNTTTYPWYSNVAPVSWMLESHVKNGRSKLNFSEWADYSDKERLMQMEEIAEVVEGKEMPPLTYWIVHGKAKLSEEDRTYIAGFFRLLQE